MTLGEKLLELRTEKGIKQEHIVFDLGIAQSTYSDWEMIFQLPKNLI